MKMHSLAIHSAPHQRPSGSSACDFTLEKISARLGKNACLTPDSNRVFHNTRLESGVKHAFFPSRAEIFSRVKAHANKPNVR